MFLAFLTVYVDIYGNTRCFLFFFPRAIFTFDKYIHFNTVFMIFFVMMHVITSLYDYNILEAYLKCQAIFVYHVSFS